MKFLQSFGYKKKKRGVLKLNPRKIKETIILFYSK